MTKVSVLEFRRDAKQVIGRLRRGQRFVLTYRGKPVARMEPIAETFISEDDPIYSLADLAIPGMGTLANEEMDRLIYEK